MRFDDDAIPYIDVFDAEFTSNPDGVYARVLRDGWVARCPFGAMIVGDEAMRDLLRDERLVTPGNRYTSQFGIEDGPYHRWWSAQLVQKNGAEHERLRRLVNRSFTPRRADLARPLTRQILNVVLDGVIPSGSCDFVTDVASVVPIQVFCQMIGVPPEDIPRFAEWAMTMAEAGNMNLLEVIGDLNQAVEGLWSYVEDLIARRSTAQRKSEDLVQELIDAREEGDRLSTDELVAMIILLLGAGYDTTATALSWGMLSILSRPGLWERLAASPEEVPRWVEEVLRFRPPAAMSARIAAEDVLYDGITIPKDTFVMMSFAGANRDPRIHPDPDTFDPDRLDSKTSVTFGAGAHFCLGAHLARAELEEAFRVLPHRLVEPKLAGEPRFGTPLGMHLVKSLPLAYSPRAVVTA